MNNQERKEIALDQYYGLITHDNGSHINEWFKDCDTIDDVVNAIVADYPLPSLISREDLTEYIKEDWIEAAGAE